MAAVAPSGRATNDERAHPPCPTDSAPPPGHNKGAEPQERPCSDDNGARGDRANDQAKVNGNGQDNGNGQGGGIGHGNGKGNAGGVLLVPFGVAAPLRFALARAARNPWRARLRLPRRSR